MNWRQSGRLLLVAAISTLAGLGIYRWAHQPPETGPPPLAGNSQNITRISHLPNFSLPDLGGRTRHSNEWEGSVLVLNFWATWCPPCLREIPAFIDVQKTWGERGLQFVGIAIDDARAVREFSNRVGINYPILLGDEAATRLSKQLGNGFGGLPYTVIFDRAGKLVHAQAGEISQEVLLKQLGPLLETAAI